MYIHDTEAPRVLHFSAFIRTERVEELLLTYSQSLCMYNKCIVYYSTNLYLEISRGGGGGGGGKIPPPKCNPVYYSELLIVQSSDLCPR